MKVLFLIGTLGKKIYHVGDEAMIKAEIGAVRKIRPEIKISVFAGDIAFAKKEMHVDAILKPRTGQKNSNLLYGAWYVINAFIMRYLKITLLFERERKALQKINESDVIVVNGGGHFNSHFFHTIMYLGANILVGKIFQKKVVAICQTIGPFNNKLSKIASKFFLNKIDIITVRDKNDSIKTLQKLNVKTKTISSIDDAYFFKHAGKNRGKELLKKNGVNLNNPIIGLSLHDFEGIENNKIQKFVSEIAEKTNSQIVLISNLFPKHDLEYAKELKKRLPTSKLFVLPGLLCDDFGAVISCIDFMVSSRYHSLVFACSNNIPCLGVAKNKYYQQKLGGLLEWTGLQKNVVKLGESFPKEIFKDKKEIQKKLEEANKKLKKVEFKNAQIIVNG